MKEKIKVLVVDDSAVMRKLLSEIISSDPEMEIVSTAINGKFALQKLISLKPDIITLDIEMPEMNGLEFLKEKMKMKDETPVVVISSLTSEGSKVTMEAFELGAKDYIHKPSGSISLNIKDLEEEIILKIKNWALKYKDIYKKSTDIRKIDNENYTTNLKKESISYLGNKIDRSSLKILEKEEVEQLKHKKNKIPENPDFIAIGISTGGPEALRTILPLLKIDIPIIIIQHMPPFFTSEFAKSLNKIVQNYKVVEASDKDKIKRNVIYIAPGGKQLGVKKVYNEYEIFINDDPPVNNHRPSVDYFFKTLYEMDSTNFIAIIMTGMGKDGAYYISKLRLKGVYTIGQDAETSIVYGMPKVAFELNGLDNVLSLIEIPEFLNNIKE
ncbi:MAG: chemotaxis-specific protein-glutamate methyltransferase CheB [Spirochaetes bacterium]|nr:chemotaxis-specific protein-glutamate methyltransferase CheB [Spirochaetota bacterium]